MSQTTTQLMEMLKLSEIEAEFHWLAELGEFDPKMDRRLFDWMMLTRTGSTWDAVNGFPMHLKQQGEYVTADNGEETVPTRGQMNDKLFMQRFAVDGTKYVVCCHYSEGRPRVFRMLSPEELALRIKPKSGR